MRLAEAIEKLFELDEDATIYARKPWTGDSECTVVKSDAGSVPKVVKAAGFAYFLEIDEARGILGVFGKRKPTADERFRLILFYAETDAFPDWVRK